MGYLLMTPTGYILPKVTILCTCLSTKMKYCVDCQRFLSDKEASLHYKYTSWYNHIPHRIIEKEDLAKVHKDRYN